MQWDSNQIQYSNQLKVDGAGSVNTQSSEKKKLRAKFWSFLRGWKEGNTCIYREKLAHNYDNKNYKLVVDFVHLSKFCHLTAQKLWTKPVEVLKIFEAAALDVVCTNMVPRPESMKNMKKIQIQITRYQRNPVAIRNIGCENLGNLLCVPGIIVSAGRVRVRAEELVIKCRHCFTTRRVPMGRGMDRIPLPRTCDANTGLNDAPCPQDPYDIVPDMCAFVDSQVLRLQEDPEDVPTGEMPRGSMLVCDRKLVDQVKPGARVRCIAICCVREESNSKTGATVRSNYLRVVGIDVVDAEKQKGVVLDEEEERLRIIASDKDIHNKISDSIAPAIWGNKEIKKAIACLMFGGTRKSLPDGTRLRGDINVLLLGDPSCGKSQFLKFVHSVAPICVYTSGKGSSAAGLTASVMKSNGEFVLEGGAMVLADGGIVCIDEFDKMREEDRVAIHEAMEQQTISIAKAGITTILNSRTSVLAAANPTFGRYDDQKSTEENIDFETTILSRFDLIFIIKDIKDPRRDKRLASHIIGLHGRDAGTQNIVGPVDLKDLGKLVSFARHNIHPRLSPSGAAMLANHYVRFREEAKVAGGRCAIPITVRQLEAIVRISESLARMELVEDVTEDHVKEAVRLFQVATMAAAKEGTIDSVGDSNAREIQKIERHIRTKVAIGSRMGVQRLVADLVRLNHKEGHVMRAMQVMAARGEVEFQNRRKMVHRKK